MEIAPAQMCVFVILAGLDIHAKQVIYKLNLDIFKNFDKIMIKTLTVCLIIGVLSRFCIDSLRNYVFLYRY